MAESRQKLTMYDPVPFRLRIQGVLDESWSDYFGMQSIATEVDGAGVPATTFVTEPVDQAALVGLINRLNGLGLPLVYVECLPEGCCSQG